MKQKVLFLTTNLPGGSAGADVLKYRNSILYTVRAFITNEYELTIKLHPAETTDYYKFLLQEYEGKFTIKQNCDLYELISQNDIVVGFPTTALLEAEKLEKKCYLINPWKIKLSYPFDNYDEENKSDNELLFPLKRSSYFANIKMNLADIIGDIIYKI